MFKCDACGKTTKPREKLTKQPVQVREKIYPFRAKANRQSGKCTELPETDEAEPDAKKKRCRDDHGGTGQEIVLEKNHCPRCAFEAHPLFG